MEPIINFPILPGVYELIAERIGAILAVELANQATLGTPTPWISAPVFLHRFQPVTADELSGGPVVTIWPGTATEVSRSPRRSVYDMEFHIDVYCSRYARQDVDGNMVKGDALSSAGAQRVGTVIRGILRHSGYFNLGFAPGGNPAIEQNTIASFETAVPERGDSTTVVAFRNTLSIRAVQNELLESPLPLSGLLTGVRLDTTDKGYRYEIST